MVNNDIKLNLVIKTFSGSCSYMNARTTTEVINILRLFQKNSITCVSTNLDFTHYKKFLKNKQPSLSSFKYYLHDLNHKKSVRAYSTSAINNISKNSNEILASIEKLSDSISDFQNVLRQLDVNPEKVILKEDAYSIILKYKSRLRFISECQEIIDIVNSSTSVGEKYDDNVFVNRISELAKDLKIKNDLECLTITSLIDPETGEKYVSSPETFKGNMERYLILVNLVSNQFPNYGIRSIEQLNDAARLDTDIKKFIDFVRIILSDVSSMPKEMFIANVPRNLYEQYLSDNLQLRQVNKRLNNLTESASAFFKTLINKITSERLEYISTKGKVLQITKYTQKDLPKVIISRIIFENLGKAGTAVALSQALTYYKIQQLSALSNSNVEVPINRYFDESLYSTESPHLLRNFEEHYSDKDNLLDSVIKDSRPESLETSDENEKSK